MTHSDFQVIEARAFEHNYIGQEHLLIGLVTDATSTAARALTALGATSERVRAAVVQMVGRGASPALPAAIGTEPAPLPVTPRLQKALNLAIDEARRLNHYHIGTGHLFLGILREGTEIGSDLLTLLGIARDAARDAVVGVLAGRAEAEPWLRRYQLVLPNDLFLAVQQLADRQDATVQEVLRRFIRLGLLVTDMQETPDAALIVRDVHGERQLVLV
ncbi:MAG: Clp protease N-terminal domain-containing protein [Dehalococcoidia bacterium]